MTRRVYIAGPMRVDGSIKQRMCRECGRERLRRRRAAAKEVMPNG